MTKSRFPDYRRPCGWNSLLPPRTPAPALAGNTTCDAVVIGAGYTGIAAARRYVERRHDADVVLIDSSSIGEGNAGRNSGFLLEVALANDAHAREIERMHACNRLIGGTMAQIVDDVHASGIDCGLRRSGAYRAAAGKAGVRALQQYRRFLDAAALPSETLSQAQLRQRIGTGFYRAGLYSPHCYLVQPASLARALASRMPASIRLYERTPALQLTQNGTHWSVTTADGTVRAPRVFLANNAFCARLGIGAARVVAMYTYAAMTAPVDATAPGDPGSDRDWGLLPAHRLGSTLRRTADGRFLIRSFYGYEQEDGGAAVEARLRAALVRRFPGLADVPFDAVWAGATGFTMNGAPLFGEVQPGLFVAAGCNGGGVVKGTLFGSLLADLALGHTVPDIGSLFGRASWMPPDPFRSLGFAVIAALERRRGRAEV